MHHYKGSAVDFTMVKGILVMIILRTYCPFVSEIRGVGVHKRFIDKSLVQSDF